MDLRSKTFALVAFVVPLIGSWLLIQVQFWFGSVVANGVYGFFLPFLGLAFATKVQFKSLRSRNTFLLSYLIAMFSLVWLIILLTSCANGDCI